MKDKLVVTLDFGSSKITCMAACKLNDGDFVVKAQAICQYNGFDSDNWYEPNTIAGSIANVIKQVEEKIKTRVREIYVGVPGVFSAIATSEASTTFLSKKKIDGYDLLELIHKANIFDSSSNTNIGGKAITYFVDGQKANRPIGMLGNKLSALVSFTFMKKVFQDSVGQALKALHIKNIHYISTLSSEGAFVANSVVENDYAIVIDVGHITTNVMLTAKTGAIFARTFALGSGYLAADLMQIVNCKYDFAMKLLTKINLNLEFQDGDCYYIDNVAVNANRSNDIVKARIGQIAEYIRKSFDHCDKEIPRSTPIILTGGGLTYLKGASDVLASYLNKNVFVYSSPVQMRRNEFVSSYGLVAEAISQSCGKMHQRW